uniref:Uncharacterized protein n=1 Tax=Anguilla anguilla TaxID=7936 RepID=A0A0E9UHS3_ANGAN
MVGASSISISVNLGNKLKFN